MQYDGIFKSFGKIPQRREFAKLFVDADIIHDESLIRLVGIHAQLPGPVRDVREADIPIIGIGAVERGVERMNGRREPFIEEGFVVPAVGRVHAAGFREQQEKSLVGSQSADGSDFANHLLGNKIRPFVDVQRVQTEKAEVVFTDRFKRHGPNFVPRFIL